MAGLGSDSGARDLCSGVTAFSRVPRDFGLHHSVVRDSGRGILGAPRLAACIRVLAPPHYLMLASGAEVAEWLKAPVC